MATFSFGDPGPQMADFSGISIPESDYVSRAWDAGTLTETWTFRLGGAGGAVTTVITIVYDAGDDIVSVTKV